VAQPMSVKSQTMRQESSLPKVWDFVHDPNAFDTYVRNEVRQFLNEQLTN
jgi:hypothetical protein